MNFGSFFRNLSTEQSDGTPPPSGNKGGDGFPGSNLFAAPSKLLGSVTAKTGSLFSDLSQKVDLGGKIDSIKRQATMDKVFGSPFMSSMTQPQEPLQQQQYSAKLEQWVSLDNETPQYAKLQIESDMNKCSLEDKPIIEENRSGQVSIHTDRYENPFNSVQEQTKDLFENTSFDSSFEINKNPLLKRQSTTPANKPPRPPPPRSGSLSIEDGLGMLTPSSSTPPILQPQPAQQTRVDEPSSKNSSADEIGYLTRLQCQEIVSVVDTMINDVIEEAPTYNEAETSLDVHPSPEISGFDYEEITNDEPLLKSPTPEYSPQQHSFANDSGASSGFEYGATTTDRNEQELLEEPPPSTNQPVDFDDREARELEYFVGEYMQGLVSGNETSIEDKNDSFKERMLTAGGREMFAKSMEIEGAKTGGLLEESGLRMLLSRIVFVLTECQKYEDFVPAKRILTTSLLFHIQDPARPGEKIFLFSYIKSQPIWHSLRFWNACFFQSVQETRAKLMEQGKSENDIGMAITEQIKSYLNTMQVFNLHATMGHEFLRKQGDLFNLNSDDIEELSTSIDEEYGFSHPG